MQGNKKRIVVVGATSAIAEHCARLWVKGADVDLTLVGRSLEKLECVAADLRVRSPKSVIRVLGIDFINPAEIRQLADLIASDGAVDVVLIAHGSLSDQAICQQDLTVCNEALAVNGLSPVLFAEAFVGYMEKANRGTLAIIGSVAGDRGRKSNYVYGAAKELVARYAQGLQHRLAATDVKVVLVKPGPTDTPMTAHLKQRGVRLASVEDVAQRIVRGIDQGKFVLYAPISWGVVMMVIRNLPRFIFNRMDI